jgi:predicted  nucleic acid-binding Zn-ribbon protein
VKQLEMAVKAKAEQIKQLTQEIDTLQQQITATNTEIAEQTAKVMKTKNDFTVSYDTVTEQIKHDVANMKKYLMPPPPTEAK